MKIVLFILINILWFVSDTEKSSSYYQDDTEKICIEAHITHDVESFYSNNPSSQKRNQIEFWEEDVYFNYQPKH